MISVGNQTFSAFQTGVKQGEAEKKGGGKPISNCVNLMRRQNEVDRKTRFSKRVKLLFMVRRLMYGVGWFVESENLKRFMQQFFGY